MRIHPMLCSDESSQHDPTTGIKAEIFTFKFSNFIHLVLYLGMFGNVQVFSEIWKELDFFLWPSQFSLRYFTATKHDFERNSLCKNHIFPKVGEAMKMQRPLPFICYVCFTRSIPHVAGVWLGKGWSETKGTLPPLPHGIGEAVWGCHISQELINCQDNQGIWSSKHNKDEN